MVSRHKGKPMQEPWGKVARWAGIGNNKEDGNLKGSAEGMAEDMMVKEMEEKELPAQSVTDAPPGSESADVAALKAELEQVRVERDQLPRSEERRVGEQC